MKLLLSFPLCVVQDPILTGVDVLEAFLRLEVVVAAVLHYQELIILLFILLKKRDHVLRVLLSTPLLRDSLLLDLLILILNLLGLVKEAGEQKLNFLIILNLKLFDQILNCVRNPIPVRLDDTGLNPANKGALLFVSSSIF